jgi:hypothetical protein
MARLLNSYNRSDYTDLIGFHQTAELPNALLKPVRS